METPSSVNPKHVLRAITVFFYSMVGGVLMFSVIVFAMNMLEPPKFNAKKLVQIFLIVVSVLSVVSVAAAIQMYRKRITSAQSVDLPLLTKLGIYRSALVIYLALCEAPALFAVIVYFLTGDKQFLIIIGLLLIAMILKRPEKSKIFNELQLNTAEQMELN